MIDILTTALIPIILAAIILLPDAKEKNRNKERNEQTNDFFSKDYTTALKGLAAIVVIFVHVPGNKGNVLQDAIGSFAYVAVTFFFLVSAYGMQLAAENNQGYLSSFWKNRLASLLIPMVLVNIACYIAKCLFSDTPELSMLIHLNNYVAVLLTYCLWFWVLEMIGNHFGLKKRTIDIINISGVVLSSLVVYFSATTSGWCFERIGLVWGLLLFRYFPAFLNWMRTNEKYKRIILLAVSLVLGVAYLKFKSVFFWGEYLLKIVLGIALLACLSLWSYRKNFGKRILLFLGGISYEIYLLHAFIMILLDEHFNISSGWFMIITIASTIIIAYLINIVARPLVSMVKRSKILNFNI